MKTIVSYYLKYIFTRNCFKMNTAEIQYIGELRTVSTHMLSGERVITDAPPDNQGKGAFFSPTDLVSSALGSCMLTIMGIAARTHHISLEGLRVTVKKVMASEPRRIAEIVLDFYFSEQVCTEREKNILEHAALHCPVAKSLHPDLVQRITFHYSSKAE
jgi:uncharacterized OsmC-like protein